MVGKHDMGTNAIPHDGGPDPHTPDPQAADRTAEFQAVLDRQVSASVRRFRQAAQGLALRDCSVCGYHGRFAPFGVPPRIDARCPACASLERHRLLLLAVRRQGLLGPDQTLLHFAPETQLRRVLPRLVGSYQTADLRASLDTDHVVNIEAMTLPDASFDRIVCNHVLEHVNDRLALAEMYRILRPGGIAFLTTPVIEGWAETYENPDVTGSDARQLYFGQHDHQRYYGRDLRDRIRAAGFVLDEFTGVEPDVRRYALWRGETLFIARKDAAA